MSDGTPTAIVLGTLNARYSHASFGLRCLRANLGELRAQSVIVEGTLQTRPLDFVALLLSHRPRVVGLGVYLWNVTLLEQVVRLLKQIAPDVVVVVGGPEVSHEIEAQPICTLADHVVRGEGEAAFLELCRGVLSPSPLRQRPAHVIDGGTPPLERLALPYDEYTDEDLQQRTVYVEASRGCPFRCAFCLSALDKRVRAFDQRAFLEALDRLWRRGLRRFKFVDRTFNLAIDDALAVLRFFRERRPEELFLHFEMIPDRLPDALLDELARFPAGAVQLEVGLQTFDDDVAAIIARRTDFPLAEANIQKLRERTGVHVHADLIAGLPGETWSSFAAGFDRLVAAGPQEIQLGVLKRLRGAPLTTIPEAATLVFDAAPPYEILRTDTLSFDALMRLRRMARTWDAVFNQGRLSATAEALVTTWIEQGSAFEGLARLSERVFAALGDLVGVSLEAWASACFEQLVADGVDDERARVIVEEDWMRGGRRRAPAFLSPAERSSAPRRSPQGPPKRQRRHLRS